MNNFGQFMEDWKRLCEAMEKKYDDGCCEKCPLYELADDKWACGAVYERNDGIDWEGIEQIITKWAEENPVPQYPTWFEYLSSMGLIESKHMSYTDYGLNSISMKTKEENVLTKNAYAPIPAEIALQLKLEPKEH